MKVERAVRFQAVVIGGSAGGGEALARILALLPGSFSLPVLVVQHLHPGDDGGFAEGLRADTRLAVSTPCDKEPISPGCVYVAPANYHMLAEAGGAIALSVDEKVRWSRPSIDVLFDSAARLWGEGLVGVLLSGANGDGAEGLESIKQRGGLTVAQDPRTAEHPVMPRSAIELGVVDEIGEPGRIAELLLELAGEGGSR